MTRPVSGSTDVKGSRKAVSTGIAVVASPLTGNSQADEGATMTAEDCVLMRSLPTQKMVGILFDAHSRHLFDHFFPFKLQLEYDSSSDQKLNNICDY